MLGDNNCSAVKNELGAVLSKDKNRHVFVRSQRWMERHGLQPTYRFARTKNRTYIAGYTRHPHSSSLVSSHSPTTRLSTRLFGLGQSNGVVAQVVDAVPLAQECVTQDGQGPHGLGEVHAHEAADARARDLQDVVVGADGEVVAGEGEGHVRQRVTLLTLDGVLSGEGLLGTNLLVPV